MKPKLTGNIFNLFFPKVKYRKYKTNKNQKQNGFGIKMSPKQLVKNIVVNLCLKACLLFLL